MCCEDPILILLCVSCLQTQRIPRFPDDPPRHHAKSRPCTFCGEQFDARSQIIMPCDYNHKISCPAITVFDDGHYSVKYKHSRYSPYNKMAPPSIYPGHVFTHQHAQAGHTVALPPCGPPSSSWPYRCTPTMWGHQFQAGHTVAPHHVGHQVQAGPMPYYIGNSHQLAMEYEHQRFRA